MFTFCLLAKALYEPCYLYSVFGINKCKFMMNLGRFFSLIYFICCDCALAKVTVKYIHRSTTLKKSLQNII